MDFSMSSKAFIHTPGTRSDMTTIIQVELLFVVWHECNSTFIIFPLFFWQGNLLGLFLLPLLYKSSLKFRDYCRMEGKQQTQEAEERTQKTIGSAVFYILLVVVLMFLVPSWTHLVQGLKVHPFVW